MVDIEKICPICYRKFNTKDRGNAKAYKYCSKECAKEAQYSRTNMRNKKLRISKNMKKYREFEDIAKKARETGIQYGRLKPLWHNKAKLKAYIEYYRTR